MPWGVVYQIMTGGNFHVINCKWCDKEFANNPNGHTARIFHEIIHDIENIEQ